MNNLEDQLLRGREFQNELSDIARDPNIGATGTVIATFRARRQRNRNADLREALKQKEQQIRSRIIGQLNPEQRALAEEVDTETLKKLVAKRLESSFEPATPLSTEGKREADVRSGLLSRDQAKAGQFGVPKVEGESLAQQADAVEQTASANAEAGNFKLATAQRATARGLRKEQGLIDKDVGKLSDKIEKIGFTTLVDSLESSLDIINQKKDIVGVGLGGFKPEITLGTEGKKLRQSIAIIKNSILKARSGAVITSDEARRLNEELGIGKGRTDEQLRIGLKNVIKIFKSKLGNIQSGVRPEALELFGQRGDNPFARLDKLSISSFGEEQPVNDELTQIEEELKRRGVE